MNITTNALAFLAFHHISGIGPRTVAALWQRWPCLFELFQRDRHTDLHAVLPAPLVEAITQFDVHLLEEDLLWQARAGEHHLLTWADDAYPALLREIAAPPLVLYARGQIACLKKKKVAIVGTRKPSCLGEETAWQFAYGLAQREVVVVSGLALGIDAQAHRGCLAAGGSTLAVLGSGIDTIYPYRHRALAEAIAETGLILSEFPLKTPPNARHFPRRNRIISGLSLATLVVEASLKSGSLITAQFALEQNREVFAIPGSIYHSQAKGCHYLLQQGAMLATSVQDVLHEIHLEDSGTHKINSKALACKNQDLVKCIGFEMTTIDQLLVRSGLSLSTVLYKLAELELEGIVKAVCGGYTRC